MNKITNRSASAITKIHGITFTVFFIIDTVLNQFLYPFIEKELSSPFLRVFISAIIAAVLYSAVYFVVKIIYDFFLIKKEKKLAIAGRWYHVHIPHIFGKEDYSKLKLRAGVTDISRDTYDFTLVGNNYYYFEDEDGKMVEDHSDDTRWYTKAINLSGENDFDLIQIYEAKTKNNVKIKIKECPCCQTHFDEPREVQEAEKFRHGIHKFVIKTDEKGKPYMIDGEFSDCWPSLKNGDLLLYRKKEDRDARIEEFLRAARREREKELQNV